MAKSKKKDETPLRSFSAVLADIRELSERFGRITHFLRMAEYLFEEIDRDGSDKASIKQIADKVVAPFEEAKLAARGDE